MTIWPDASLSVNPLLSAKNPQTDELHLPQRRLNGLSRDPDLPEVPSRRLSRSNVSHDQRLSRPESGWAQIEGAAAMRFRRSREVYPIYGRLSSLIEGNDWCTLSASGVSYADL